MEQPSLIMSGLRRRFVPRSQSPRRVATRVLFYRTEAP